MDNLQQNNNNEFIIKKSFMYNKVLNKKLLKPF